MPDPEVLVVAVAGTAGWRSAANELADAFERSGAQVRRAIADQPRRVRTFALTDLMEAQAGRRACRDALRARSARPPRAIVYCSITTSLLWPRPGAIWLDAVAAENRPGRHGVWQRTVEQRRLAQAPLVLTMSERSLPPTANRAGEEIVVPVPVQASGAAGGGRPLHAIAYAADPQKRRLADLLSAWRGARREGERLVIAGIDPQSAIRALGRAAGGLPALTAVGVELAGRLPGPEYRALLRSARVFLAAPTREDYGIAPLEALADGCMLVTTPAAGPYPALGLARRLDPRLVDADLGRGLRAALDSPAPGYADRARDLLAPFSRAAVDRTIAERVLPGLLTTWAKR